MPRLLRLLVLLAALALVLTGCQPRACRPCAWGLCCPQPTVGAP